MTFNLHDSSLPAYAPTVGTTPTNYPHLDTRDPTTFDVYYKVGKIWINTTSENYWYLNNQYTSMGALQSNWVLLESGAKLLISLSDTSNTVVFPSPASSSPPNNIQLVGGTGITVVATPTSNLLTISATSAGDVSGMEVDTFTSPGTNPVLPNGSGIITVTGGQVAAGTTTHVIQTDSLAANTYTIQVQRSQAVASSTVGDNGVSHYDSAQFAVDGNGFVTLKGGTTPAVLGITPDTHTSPGTSPVLPNSSGDIILTGGQVPAGTTVNVIETNSLAANTCTIDIQRSQAVASSTVGDNGVSHFNSADFTVDSNGFVSLAAPPSTKPAFLATYSSSVPDVVGDAGTIYLAIYDTTIFDTLSNYDSSTGIFTASVAGIYNFTAVLNYMNVDSSKTSYRLDFVKNSTTIIHGETGNAFNEASEVFVYTAVATVNINMAIGDTMNVQTDMAYGSNTVGILADLYPGTYQNSFSGAMF
jgi:C1q domain